MDEKPAKPKASIGDILFWPVAQIFTFREWRKEQLREPHTPHSIYTRFITHRFDMDGVYRPRFSARPRQVMKAGLRKIQYEEKRVYGPFGGSLVLLWFLLGLGVVIAVPHFDRVHNSSRGSEEYMGNLINALVGVGIFLLGLLYWHNKKYFTEKVPARRSATEVATPEETKRAVNHLRLANAYFEEGFKAKDGDKQLRSMNQATHELMKASSLDPRATLTIKDKEGKEVTYDQDQLAGMFLYIESDIHYQTTKNIEERGVYEWIKGDDHRAIGNYHDRFDVYLRDKYKEALPGAEKAVKYQPNNLSYLVLLAKVYLSLDQRSKAQETAERAAEIDPDNIEVLKLVTSFE